MAEERADERLQIAGYLHDDLAQVLFRLSIQVDVARKLMDKEDYPQVTEQLEKIRESKQETSDRIRALIRDLHRSPLGAKGLAEALESFTDEVGRDSGVMYHRDVEDIPLPAPIALLVYHIAREGVMNSLKHAHATGHVDLGAPGRRVHRAGTARQRRRLRHHRARARRSLRHGDDARAGHGRWRFVRGEERPREPAPRSPSGSRSRCSSRKGRMGRRRERPVRGTAPRVQVLPPIPLHPTGRLPAILAKPSEHDHHHEDRHARVKQHVSDRQHHAERWRPRDHISERPQHVLVAHQVVLARRPRRRHLGRRSRPPP